MRESELGRARAEAFASQERRVRRRNLLLAATLFLLLLGTASIYEWTRRTRLDEAALLSSQLTSAMERAIGLRDAAHTDVAARDAAFEGALAILSEAKARATDAPDWLRLKLDSNLAATRDMRGMQKHEAAVVDALRRNRANLRSDPPEVRVAAYQRLFHALHVPVSDEAIPVALCAEAVAAKRSHRELVIALDDWARLIPPTGRPGLAARIVAIANAADPDPSRGKIRAASLAGATSALLSLAASTEMSAAPAESLLLLVHALLAHSEHVQAENLLQRALALHPTDPRLNHLMGTHLTTHRDNTDAALQHLWRALAAEPESLAHRDVICTAFLLAHRATDARRMAEEMLCIDPASMDAHIHLGGAAMLLGHLDESVSHFDAAIAINPDNVHGHALKGLALRRKGDLPGMLACMRTAFFRAPQHPLSRKLLSGALQDLQQHEAALPLLEASSASESGDPILRFSLARTQSQLGQSAAAVENYQSVVAARPDWAEAWCNLGRELGHLGRFPEAVAAFRRGHELGSERGDAWQYSSALWLKDAERIEAAMWRLAQLAPESESALSTDDVLLLGRAAALSNDAPRAARLLADAIKRTPEVQHKGAPASSFLLARALITSGESSTAPRVLVLLQGLLDTLTATTDEHGRLTVNACVELSRLLADAACCTWLSAADGGADETAKRMTLLARWRAVLSGARADYLR